MTFANGIAMGGAALTLAINVGAFLVAWGVVRATLDALAKRVAGLESEMGAITTLKVEVARISERQEFLIEQLRDLNASLRWMRAASDDGPARRPRAARPPG